MEGLITPQSDIIFTVLHIPFSNSVLASILVSVAIPLGIVLFLSKPTLIPGRLQAAFEGIMEFFLSALTKAYGSPDRARKFFPFIMTLFLFLACMNQFSIMPLVTSIVTEIQTEGGIETVKLFRIASSDWSLTVALALISIIGAHTIAFTINPLQHIGNYIKLHKFLEVRSPKDLTNAVIENFLGLMDIIGELAKIISMSARLFGNIFAGELMGAIIAGIAFFTQFIFPMPFVLLGMFSGLVQAFVFTFLSLLFMAGTVRSVQPRKAYA